MAVGNPMGERNATTMGLVSANGADASGRGGPQPIQVAITLRPGNSGGALADIHGRVVGIPNMVVGAGRVRRGPLLPPGGPLTPRPKDLLRE